MNRWISSHVRNSCILAAAWPAFSASEVQLVPADIVSRFDHLEVESIDANITAALNTLPDSWTQTWFSANSQATGTLSILRSFDFNSSFCREVEIMSKQKGYRDQRTISFCRDADLSWRPLSDQLKVLLTN